MWNTKWKIFIEDRQKTSYSLSLMLGKATSHILQHNTVQNNIRLKHSRRLHSHNILANKWHSWDPCLSQKLVFIPEHHKILTKKHKTKQIITSGLSDYQGYGAYQMAYVVMNS